MKHKYLIISAIILAVYIVSGCSLKDKNAIKKTVLNYTDAFYSGEIEKAMIYCTNESGQAIRFNLIIIDDDTKQVMKDNPHTASILNIKINNNTAETDVILKNYYDPSSMQLEEIDTITYQLKKIDEKWYID